VRGWSGAVISPAHTGARLLMGRTAGLPNEGQQPSVVNPSRIDVGRAAIPAD
jgi:hypothetical protein